MATRYSSRLTQSTPRLFLGRSRLPQCLLTLYPPPAPAAAAAVAVRSSRLLVLSSLKRHYHDHHGPGLRLLCRWYSAFNTPPTPIWTFDRVKKHLKEPDANVHLVDVREPHELQTTGKIPGAINIPMSSVVRAGCYNMPDGDFVEMHGFDRPPRDATLVFYCAAGVRAASASELARAAGWANVAEYQGSWNDWSARRGPVEPVPSKGAT